MADRNTLAPAPDRSIRAAFETLQTLTTALHADANAAKARGEKAQAEGDAATANRELGQAEAYLDAAKRLFAAVGF